MSFTVPGWLWVVVVVAIIAFIGNATGILKIHASLGF